MWGCAFLRLGEGVVGLGERRRGDEWGVGRVGEDGVGDEVRLGVG